MQKAFKKLDGGSCIFDGMNGNLIDLTHDDKQCIHRNIFVIVNNILNVIKSYCCYTIYKLHSEEGDVEYKYLILPYLRNEYILVVLESNSEVIKSETGHLFGRHSNI